MEEGAQAMVTAVIVEDGVVFPPPPFPPPPLHPESNMPMRLAVAKLREA